MSGIYVVSVVCPVIIIIWLLILSEVIMIAYYIGRVLVVVQTSTSTFSVPMVFCMSVHGCVLFVRENNLLFSSGRGKF